MYNYRVQPCTNAVFILIKNTQNNCSYDVNTKKSAYLCSCVFIRVGRIVTPCVAAVVSIPLRYSVRAFPRISSMDFEINRNRNFRFVFIFYNYNFIFFLCAIYKIKCCCIKKKLFDASVYVYTSLLFCICIFNVQNAL